MSLCLHLHSPISPSLQSVHRLLLQARQVLQIQLQQSKEGALHQVGRGVTLISSSPPPPPSPVSVSPVQLTSLPPLGLEDLWRPPATSSTVVPSDTPGRTTVVTYRRWASVSLSAAETLGKHTLTSPIKTSRNTLILLGSPGDSTGSVQLLTMSVI